MHTTNTTATTTTTVTTASTTTLYHVMGDMGIAGDFPGQSQGAAFLDPRQLLSEEKGLDFTWIPATLDVLQG
jgi:hypothetical protein